MITMIQELPDGVLGASAAGEVTADDYRRVLVPAIESELISGGTRLRFLYNLGPDFERIKPDAMWQDVRIRMAHMRDFERVALVTDVEWISRAVNAFAWLIPGDVRTYGNDGFDEAVTWLAH